MPKKKSIRSATLLHCSVYMLGLSLIGRHVRGAGCGTDCSQVVVKTNKGLSIVRDLKS
jgi:hypothetical protein